MQQKICVSNKKYTYATENTYSCNKNCIYATKILMQGFSVNWIWSVLLTTGGGGVQFLNSTTHIFFVLR